MGVRGFHKVLQREGWLPDDSKVPCCSTSLWRDASVMHNCPSFAERVGIVKKRSTFYMDGSGLAFQLYRTAYARHAAEVLASSSSSSSSNNNNNNRRQPSSSCQCSAKKLTADQATKLLPNLLPLTKLDEVTREFVTTLQQKHHIDIQVYFDGELRREAKRATDAVRRQKRPSEWSALQQYCCNGVMPSVNKVCEWDGAFPKNRLFIEQIKYTLRLLHVDIVICPEEADAELARAAAAAAAANSRSNPVYVVGNDTDFCFFPNAVQYIPLQTLHASDSVVTASIMSRETLATSLHLPDSNAMIELAILLRNDYVTTLDKLDFNNHNMLDADDILDHLRSSGEGYRVTSNAPETQTAIRFVRKLYNLENLDEEFPLRPKYAGGGALEKDEDDEEEEEEVTGPVLKIPKDFPEHLMQMQPGDTSLKGAILRVLQAYLDQAASQESTVGNDKIVLRQEHLEAFKLMSSHQNDNPSSSMGWKPQWEDIKAAFLIASCILYVRRKAGPNHPLVRLSPPDKLFDEFVFHATLQNLRKPASHPNSEALGEQDRKAAANSSSSPSSKRTSKAAAEPRLRLPVDEHESTILSTIARNRVTIIQGETGCGKSSRVPIMVMNAPPPEPLTEVKLFISQPRRIAAKALVERLRATEPELGGKIALRMGHGVREYENSSTQAWFVTTGYLVRLLAGKPQLFNKVSHLIIDEIHERSVDTDVLCLLCRRLLHSNPHIRLVLMSATLAAKLYQDYFDIAEAPIKVGARRFPIETIFVEELPGRLQFPPKEAKAAKQIENECRRTMCIAPPSNTSMECVYSLAARIAISVGRPGSSVLIFVPGMNDIVSISEKIEATYVPGVIFTIIPIHSDIPFEDQMTVFDEMEDEVKIIIATNAAESSLTLPDCDHVIDTGLEKKITYNVLSHRQMLLPCWISKASAQQRSGRVGRVRPGQVFRLYSREAYETMMCEFESGEMLRMPLDSVILLLKEILHDEKTTPALMSCIEPPDMSNIDRSYQSLFKANFISQPDDAGAITLLGAFVTALGIDLTLGALIGLGIQFGVGPEAIELAAVLSFPKTPWLLSNPLVHKPNQFNSGTVKTYVSKNIFDAELYSEPLATMNLMQEYSQLTGSKMSFCNHHGVHQTRIRRLISTRDNIVGRVADFIKIDPSLLRSTAPPARMPHAKLNILRIIQTWLFCDTIIEFKPLSLKPNSDGSVTIPLKSKIEIKEEHLDKLIRPDRHPYVLNTHVEVEQTGGFKLLDGETFELNEFLPAFEERFVSFVVEKGFDLSWFWFENELRVYVTANFSECPGFEKISKLWGDRPEQTTLRAVETTSGRGRSERASGMWTVYEVTVDTHLDETLTNDDDTVLMKRFIIQDPGMINNLNNALRACVRKIPEVKWSLSFDFSKNSKRKKKSSRVNPVCQISCLGEQRFKVSHTDFCDLLAISNLKENYWLLDKRESSSQAIVFESMNSDKIDGPKNSEISLYESDESSWKRPLLRNIPEGGRLLAVLASSRRRENNIQLTIPKNEDGGASEEDEVVSFSLDHGLSRMTQRWSRLNTDRQVLTFENSVPASVVPVDCQGALYSCCANTLDLRGGAMKAEGLTLLPPGSFFLLLSFLAFGMAPDGLGSFPQEDDDVEEFIQNCLTWVEAKDGPKSQNAMTATPIDWPSRIRKTIEFARSCANMGEQLECFPDKVRGLCEIFDGVDGHAGEVWASLDSNPSTSENRRKHRELVRLTAGATRPERSYNRDAAPATEVDIINADGAAPMIQTAEIAEKEESEAVPAIQTAQTSAIDEEKHEVDATIGVVTSDGTLRPLSSLNADEGFQEEKKSKDIDIILRGSEVRRFSEHLLFKSRKMFAPELGSSETIDDKEMPTTNILALCVKQFYAGVVYASYMQPDLREELTKVVEKRSVVRLTKEQWTVHQFVDQNGKKWYRAIFSDSNLPLKSRNTRGLVKWIRYDRPYTIMHALECCPEQFRDVEILETEVFEDGDIRRKAVLFDTIETALRMEAAFFLERTFCTKQDHWYEQGLDLMQLLLKRTPPISQLLQTFQHDINFSLKTTTASEQTS